MIYSASQTEDLFNKFKEMNVKLDAHKMDFTKPLKENDLKGESKSIEFVVPCHVCGKNGFNRMCTCTIPFFKEIIIMAFTCENCGARSTEVKVGGGIPEKGTKLTLKVLGDSEINREVFKSETAAIIIPEIGVEVMSGSLGGVFSTVEGLIEKMLSVLKDDNPFVGDSSDVKQTSNFEKFLVKLQDLKDGKLYPFTIILDDPMSNCFIQNPNHPKEDPMLKIEIFERTFEQNEMLGINDMKV